MFGRSWEILLVLFTNCRELKFLKPTLYCNHSNHGKGPAKLMPIYRQYVPLFEAEIIQQHRHEHVLVFDNHHLPYEDVLAKYDDPREAWLILDQRLSQGSKVGPYQANDSDEPPWSLVSVKIESDSLGETANGKL